MDQRIIFTWDHPKTNWGGGGRGISWYSAHFGFFFLGGGGGGGGGSSNEKEGRGAVLKRESKKFLIECKQGFGTGASCQIGSGFLNVKKTPLPPTKNVEGCFTLQFQETTTDLPSSFRVIPTGGREKRFHFQKEEMVSGEGANQFNNTGREAIFVFHNMNIGRTDSKVHILQ